MLGKATSLSFLCLLGACAGADFTLPAISENDINSASLAVAGDTAGMVEYYRSDEEYEQIIANVSNRLRGQVQSLCRASKIDRCYFLIEYNKKNEVNATADQNNRIVLYRGLLRYLETEDEVAAVVGHEMGHVIADHVREEQTNATIGSIIGGLIIGGLGAAAGSYNTQSDVDAGMKLGGAIGAISFSKEQEREADLIAAYLVDRAQYNLEAAGRVFRVLARLSGSKTKAGLFDTHLAGPERIAAWQKAIAEVRASADKIPNLGDEAEVAMIEPRTEVDPTPIKRTGDAAKPQDTPKAAAFAADRLWELAGQTDACGQPWSAKFISSKTMVRGELRRGDVAYQFVARLAGGGQANGIVASKLPAEAGKPAPRFLRLDLDLSKDPGVGVLSVDSGGQYACRSEFQFAAGN